MVKYCSKCGTENDDDSEFCTECKNSFINRQDSENKSILINKKTILIGAAIVVIIAIVSIFALTGGNLENTQYIGTNTISIDSVSKLGTAELTGNNSDGYSGVFKGYEVVYTAKSNLKNVSIQARAYDKDGNYLNCIDMPEYLPNYGWDYPSNLFCFQKNLTAGSSYTADLVFGSQNLTDFKVANLTDFEVAKLEVYVYQTISDENKLIDKFDYNMNN